MASVAVRVECALAAARAFGLRPQTPLPIRLDGGALYLSGRKRPGQPWVLTLRGRIGGGGR